MTTLLDCYGNRIRVTAERLSHILDHPEMNSLAGEMAKVLARPKLVRRSASDPSVRLFYEFYPQTVLGGKWLCVVVKYVSNDAFVITAYLTANPKAGEDLWPIK